MVRGRSQRRHESDLREILRETLSGTGPALETSEETVIVTEPNSSHEEEPLLDPADPQGAAYLALHAERAALEEELTLQQQRQRFGSDDREIASARATESSLLKDLDRVLTMIRAAEVRRQQPKARRWQ